MSEPTETDKVVAAKLAIALLDKVDPEKFKNKVLNENISIYLGIYSSFLREISPENFEKNRGSLEREARSLLM